MRVICNAALPMRRDVILDRMTVINPIRACGMARAPALTGARIHLGVTAARKRVDSLHAATTNGNRRLHNSRPNRFNDPCAIRLSRSTPADPFRVYGERKRERGGGKREREKLVDHKRGPVLPMSGNLNLN